MIVSLVIGCCCFNTQADISNDSELANSAQWLALLHIHKGEPQIIDSDFLLSSNDSGFSPRHSLRATRDLFLQQREAICRFPARYLWMQKHGLIAGDAAEESCPDYAEFLRSVPIDEVSVIFASEQLASPSSMMGHSMLALTGENGSGQNIDHGVSFFTPLDSGNPASLIYETMIVGKRGILSVHPLQQALSRYRFDEQRNVWRYPLVLNDYQRELIQAHLWELKQVDIPYYFQSHNCATVTLDILRIAVDIDQERSDWISPIDLVNEVDRWGIIRERQLFPSERWQVRMLGDFINKDDKKDVVAWVEGDSAAAPLGLMPQLLARHLISYRRQEGLLGVDDYRALTAEMTSWPTTEVILTDYRDPLKNAPDSYIDFGWEQDNTSDWITLDWTPSSHDLSSDNRNYFGESALQLSALGVRYRPTDMALQLNSWELYRVRALNPYHSLTGGWSGYLDIAFERKATDSINSRFGLTLAGGGGLTAQLGRDAGVYALLGMKLRTMTDDVTPYVVPELGAWLYEIGNMKSWLSYKIDQPIHGERINRVAFDHSVKLGRRGQLNFSIEKVKVRQDTVTNSSAALRYYF